MAEKVSELTVFKFELKTPKNVEAKKRARWALADFLETKGFKPGHWYANWKELQQNVWLIIGGTERGDPSGPVLSCKVTLRNAPPNVGGEQYQTEEVEKFRAYCEKTVKPMVLALLDESKIPYEALEKEEGTA